MRIFSKHNIKSISLVIIGAAIAYKLNFYTIEDLIIPDICYYHFPQHKPGFLFNLFYDLPDWNGGHPYATNFNFFFTFLVGALPGIVYFIKYKKIRISTDTVISNQTDSGDVDLPST